MVRLRDRNQVTLPADVMSQLGLQPGDWLELILSDNSLQLRPAQIVTAGTPEAEGQEKVAEDNLRRKNYSTYNSIEEFDRHLDKVEGSDVLESPSPIAEAVTTRGISVAELKRRLLSAVEEVLQHSSVK